LTWLLDEGCAASSSAVPPISPIMMMPSVSGSSLNSFEMHVDEVGAVDGSPPMPTQVDWPRPSVGQLVDRLVGQRAGARDDADLARLVDVAGHDADLAAFLAVGA
jgi:hypothetical protein